MKKYSHSYNSGRRINWRSLTIAFTIAICFFISSNANRDEVYYADTPTVSVYMTATVVEATSTPESIEDKIRHYFPKNWKTMIAIAHAESNMNMDAKGYNCYYNNDKTIVYETRVKGSHSTACKKEHRVYSWSIDCGILQRNYPGRKTCPKITIDEHLHDVAELSKVQGLSAWSSYNAGAHIKYLANK